MIIVYFQKPRKCGEIEMNLKIFYEVNKTGSAIIEELTQSYPQTVYKEIGIGKSQFYNITVNVDDNSPTRILNSKDALTNCLTEDYIGSIMQVNGIPFLKDQEKVNRVYRVMIADLKIISIKINLNTKTKEPTKKVRERFYPKVAEMARRAIHVLGLDFAQITLVLTSRRVLKVARVNPSPELSKGDFKGLIDCFDLNLKEKTGSDRSEVKLGADPEFMMINRRNGRIVFASNFFPREGHVGCDSIRVPNRYQRPVAEIRPSPSTCPVSLANNIRQSLLAANRMAPYRNIKWVAGSLPAGDYSIGGHVHFSNIRLNGGLLRALDNFLGIPIFLLEQPSTAVRRRKKYGFLGDYRLKNHGGFEYRTPSSWLVSHKISRAVLCLAKIVAARYLLLQTNYLNSVEAQKSFYAGNQDYFRDIFGDLWKQLSKIDLFDMYSEHLEVIKDMVDNGLSWDEKNDFRRNWEISVSRKTYSGQRRSDSRSALIARSQTPRNAVVSPGIRVRRSQGSRTIRGNSGSGDTRNTGWGNNRTQTGRIVPSGRIGRTAVTR